MIRAIALRPADYALAILEGWLRPAVRRAAPDPDETRASRAFIAEMLDRSPDAFSSDFDIEAVMRHYPSVF